MAEQRPTAAGPVSTGQLHLQPNLLGIPFGVIGLAQCWAVAARDAAAPSWPANLCWLLATALWILITVGLVANAVAGRRLTATPDDPVFGPFSALAAVIAMPLGVAWSQHDPGPGGVLYLVGMALTIFYGGWLTGRWITADLSLAQWHPGYLLPTVAGGLLASGGAAALGHQTLASVLLGYGALSWLVLGSIVLARLFIGPPLPAALTPTLAIELAPPVVAGSSWFAINGGRADAVALGLAGYAVLMAFAQVPLINRYRALRFGPGWWAFSFSYAAAVAYALRWLAIADPPGAEALSYALLALVTAALGALLTRTTIGLVRRDFLPRVPTSAGEAPSAALGLRRPTLDSAD